MKCHYDVLNVARDANDTDIKKAYKKLALQWHPDKNLDPDKNLEAKEQFQLLQQAYEVLIDPHERAFYDKHRDQILKGKNSNYEEASLDVYQYFTTTCYKGFNDSEPNNFYKVYSEVFAKIFSEDFEYMSEEEIEAVPEFGKSNSDYETVVRPFYNYADCYSTKKSYAWLSEVHDISEVRNRKVIKILDKENKKIQMKARKERNEEVRGLVAFVKKRDKRVQAYRKLIEERVEINRQKSEQKKIEQMKKLNDEVEEQRKKMGSVLNEGYEEQLKELEANYFDLYINDGEEILEEDSDLLDDLFCEVCNRNFKDSQSYTNHLSTKKHRLNETLLSTTQNSDPIVKDDEAVEEVESTLNEPDLDISEAKTKSKRKTTKNKSDKVIVLEENDHSDSEVVGKSHVDQSDDDDFDWNAKKKGKKVKQKGLNKGNLKTDTSSFAKPVKAEIEISSESVVQSETATSFLCETCKSSFLSKNKLFDHLKKTNHSVYLPKEKKKNKVK